ncbi:MAG: SLBB domain-containing protein [Paraprevotella sp.]|nr:SLBB domain-containing protein [Paraprevotella sp.]MBP3471290.1 SLBB domain-containing protein [Paraprevotella sp.]
MIKRYIFLCLFGACAIMAYAQSAMTDEQIMQYVLKAHEAGKSNSQIASELMKKGVNISRLQQIKNKYEKQQKGTLPGAKDILGSGSDEADVNRRLRESNTPEERKNGINQRSNVAVNRSKLTDKQRRLYDSNLQSGMTDELGLFAPDSMMLMTEEMYKAYGNEEDGRKKVFGRDIFNLEMLSFEPNMNVATPANYRLGAGDDVYIDVWGASEKSIQATISPDGTIQVEGLGPVNVAGMTVAAANAYLQTELKKIYASSNIRVTVGQTKTITVNVMGEVVAPGTYTLSAFATAFHALYVSGGVNDIGTLRDIKIYRNSRLVSTVDVYDYILNGRMGDNIRLEDNDMIYVGTYNSLVDITGKVKRPMFYEMKGGETLSTLLKFSGGFSGDAYKNSVRLIRKTGRDYSIHTVEEFDMASFSLMDGDSVTVDSIIPRFSNMVEVKGAVYRPGMYQMDGKIKTVRELMKHIDGVTEEAFLGRALLHRRREDRSLETVALNLGQIIEGEAPDVPLHNEDVLYVFSNEEAQNEQTMTVYGEVRYPGIYHYARNTSLEDFILQAGGLTDAASTVKVDVARRIVNRSALNSGRAISKTYTFALKDGLVVDGEPGFTLEPFDEVYVRKSPEYHVQQNVKIEGEVAFEGEYVLSQKNERLSDLIKRAGGFTDDAYVKGARLERNMTEEEMIRKQATLKLTASGDSIDMSTLDLATTYSVGIELEKAMAEPGGDYDVVLRDGDRLTVPGMQNTVKINGAVMFPNTVAYRNGAKLSYYIGQAGGYSSKAKRRHAFIVNINGTVARASKVKDIQPGSEIIVPTKEERRKLTPSEMMTIGTSTASLATMVATIVTLFKK